ncbi:hypothetical protein [Thermus tengchongensis]|uniref:hypothetical protein n=1 Tax=Thermus tengchongensis TaxID=1214928 RepID=UPI000AD3D630|nr:hypothetical protein [Thermus tengchongensis]
MKALAKEVVPVAGLALLTLMGAYFLVELLGQNPATTLLVLSPGLRYLFRGRVGVVYGGAVLGLAGGMTLHLGGPYAALAYLALALAVDGFLRKEEEGYGFLLGFFPTLVAVYLALRAAV